jgi:MFS family permease
VTRQPSRARSYLTQVRGALGAVLGNPQLRRVQLAYVGFNCAEWAVWIAMIVYAYDRGGATTAALVAVAQLVPSALFAPFASTLGDRARAGRVLFWGYVAQAVGMGATAAVLLADGPALVAYAFAACASTSITVTRPTQAALLPSLARRPNELTAANVVSGWVESASVLVAPALAGVLLDAGGAGWVFAPMALATLVGALLVWSVPGPPPAGAHVPRPGVLRETLEAAELVRGEPAARSLVFLLTVASVGLGALDVLYAELAIGRLGLSDGWAGYLNAAFGLGGVLAILVTATFVGRRTLAPALLGGLGIWCVALVLLGVGPTVATALVFLALSGVGHGILDVSGRTLLQRTAPANLLARVFGLLESLSSVGLAIGSLLVPVLVALGGAEAALVGVGLLLPLCALVVVRSVRQSDRRADVPVVEIGLLRSLPLFAALPAPELEGLARALVPVEAEAGDVVLTEGEVGDRFYVVADGRLDVTQGGKRLRNLERGSGFGEIALLHDVPRTATCTAASPVHLYALERPDFLAAVTGHPQAAEEARRLAAARLAVASS